MFRTMSDIRLVLYKDNRAPKSIALSTRMLYRSMLLTAFGAALLITSAGLAAKFYLLAKAKNAQATSTANSSLDNEMGPSNSLEALNKGLHDEIEQLRSQLANAAATQAAPKEIDKRNPALALFSPIVVDRAQNQNQVRIVNIKSSVANKITTLTFELHNAHEGESTEKGYIVVLGRGENVLHAYPNAFNRTGPFLLDFEKGETFQVARFRMVNAQFEGKANQFQILIFTRRGELLINTMHEVKNSGE